MVDKPQAGKSKKVSVLKCCVTADESERNDEDSAMHSTKATYKLLSKLLKSHARR